jgi:hypothetical protein
MRVTFIALRIPVLNFSYKPDTQGSIIPPETYAKFNEVVPVTYGGGSDDMAEQQVGNVRLYREGNVLFGDFTLFSFVRDDRRALWKIQKLTPAVAYMVTDAVGKSVFKIEIEYIVVTTYPNDDPRIKPFGERILLRPEKKDMN